MEFKVIIEEAVAQEFAVEAASREEALEIAREKYESGEFVLCPGEVQGRRMAACEPADEAREWIEF